MAKTKKMTDDELASQLSNEIESASGNFNTELSSQREESMKYYLGEPFGNEIEGRSQIVTTDVRDTIEYIMPSLMRIFTTHNNTAEFEPQGPEDVEMAQQATDYVNYVFNKQNNGFKVLYDAFKDALISKTGVIKHFWEEKTEVSHETYENLTEIEYQSILANDDFEVVEHTEIIVQKQQVDEKFSGMINALSYGAPPHGGIAPGIDRIVMLLANEKNIREVTMFPMNQNAQDLMMNAPSEVNEEQLKELGLALKPKK